MSAEQPKHLTSITYYSDPSVPPKWANPFASNDEQFHWTWDTVILTPVLGFIVLGTILGNFAVLLHFFQKLRSKGTSSVTPTQFFIANLAMADFLVGVFVLPLLSILQITEKWYFGQCMCTIWVSTHYTLCAASIMSTCAVCIERYVGVRYPIQHMRILSVKRIMMGIMLVWILALVPSLLRVFAWTEPKIEIPYHCIINQKLGHALVGAVGIFYIPGTIMIILYLKIYIIASQHMQGLKTGERKGSKGLLFRVTSGKGGKGTQEQDAIEKRQINLARKLSVLVCVVLFSYGPYFTLILLKGIEPSWVNHHVFDTFAWVRYFNSFLNPFIYAYAVPAFNQAFRKSFVGRRLTSVVSRSTTHSQSLPLSSTKDNGP